jgi:hypothetical protein
MWRDKGAARLFNHQPATIASERNSLLQPANSAARTARDPESYDWHDRLHVTAAVGGLCSAGGSRARAAGIAGADLLERREDRVRLVLP